MPTPPPANNLNNYAPTADREVEGSHTGSFIRSIPSYLEFPRRGAVTPARIERPPTERRWILNDEWPDNDFRNFARQAEGRAEVYAQLVAAALARRYLQDMNEQISYKAFWPDYCPTESSDVKQVQSIKII